MTDLLALVREAALEELPALLGRLAEAEAIVRMRINTAAPTNGKAELESEPPRLLTPEQAAEIIGVNPKWVLRNTKGVRFRRDLSRKVVRFEEAGLRRWAAVRRP